MPRKETECWCKSISRNTGGSSASVTESNPFLADMRIRNLHLLYTNKQQSIPSTFYFYSGIRKVNLQVSLYSRCLFRVATLSTQTAATLEVV
jgi:hypothetical protein